MFSNFNIEQILTFPIKEAESRRNFLIGVLVYFSGFIIPILPMILVMGYIARLMRQVMNSEEPHMPAWDDWGSMLKDGVYIFGIRIIYTLPLLIIFIPLFLGVMFLPVWLNSNSGSNEMLILFPFLLSGLMTLIIFPLSLALGIVVPAAEAHTIAQDDFVAGFRIREWWRIFRANLGGFIIAYLISMLASFASTIIMQILMVTIILICILPFLMPAILMYTMLVMYTAFAQAYRNGKNKLAQ